MMAPLITYGGIPTTADASFALSLGTTAGAASLTIAPLPPAAIPRYGELRCTYGGTLVWALPDCAVDSAASTLDGSGHVVTLTVLDRRWRWRYGSAFGEYNIRDAAGGIFTWSAKTPARLAEILFAALGEVGADVSALDGIDDYPHVKWAGEGAAAALSSLCERYGRRVAYGIDDRVRVVRLGDGPALPIIPELQRPTAGLDPAERPSSVVVVGGPTLYQRPLPLLAVGQDTDGTVRPIGNLSYTPTNGWHREPNGMQSLVAAVHNKIDDASTRMLKLALATVHRWFTVDMDALAAEPPDRLPPGTGIPAGSPVEAILPLDAVLIESVAGTSEPKRSRCFGTYFVGNLGNYPRNSSPGDGYVIPWDHSIEGDKGLVVFEKPTRRWHDLTEDWALNSSGEWAPALIWCECVFHLRRIAADNSGDNDFLRYSRSRSVEPAARTAPEVIVAEELVERVRMLTTTPDTNPGMTTNEWTTNREELDALADEILDAHVAKYEDRTTGEGVYVGLLAFDVGGTYHQVTWSVGEGGAITTVSFNSETNPFVPTYKGRLRDQGISALKVLGGTKLFAGGLYGNDPK